MVRMDWARSFMASPAIDYAFSSVEPDVRRTAGSSPQNLAKAPQCESKQHRSEAEEGKKLGPDDVDAGAAKDDRLRQHDEVSVRRGQHDGLNDLRHAFPRRRCARQQLHGSSVRT